MHTAQAREESRHFFAGQDDVEPRRRLRALDVIKPRKLDAEDLEIQKEQRALRLILRAAATVRSTARLVRNVSTSGAPMSDGWRLS